MKPGRATLHDEMPPENEFHVPGASRNLSKNSATAIVRIARERPHSRRAGTPTSSPPTIDAIPPTTSAGQKLQPWPPTSEPTVKAPIAANEYWQNETWPTSPVNTTSDSTISPMISEYAASDW